MRPIRYVTCDNCRHPTAYPGRAFDGRRAYRCVVCGHEWTNGRNGRRQRFSKQRMSNQFADSRKKTKAITQAGGGDCG